MRILIAEDFFPQNRVFQVIDKEDHEPGLGQEEKPLFIRAECRTGNEKFVFFDADFNHLDLVQQHPMSGRDIPKPVRFEEMKEVASKLSKGIPHVRIDLYEVKGQVYFGEFTFYHHGGCVPFHPHKWDDIFGSWIALPKKDYK